MDTCGTRAPAGIALIIFQRTGFSLSQAGGGGFGGLLWGYIQISGNGLG